MAILSSALQTLSEMAVIESNIDIPKETSSDICQLLVDDLAKMEYLTEEEMVFDVKMVPIRSSKRLRKYLIEMEDLSRFMMSNKITSIQDAIGRILTENNLEGQYHNVGLIIDEDSILNELASLGYNITTDCWKAAPKPGLGMPMIGKDHRDFQYFRDIANTKQLMDLLTGRYGLPLIKKSYKQIGLLGTNENNPDQDPDPEHFVAENTEDVKIKPQDGNTILQEKPYKSKLFNNKKITESAEIINEEIKLEEKEIKPIQEKVDRRELYIQQLRDIAAGKDNSNYDW